MDIQQTRRKFLKQTALLGAAVPLAAQGLAATPEPAPAPRKTRSPNERLNIGVIGVRGRGQNNLKAVSGENIVALCDVDRNRLAEAKADHPDADAYEDFRQVLDHKELDAIVVSTPDHMHALPVVWGLRAGLDVYCEKPLAHSVHEVRTITELAAQKDAITQLGTQIHARDNYRRVVELVKSGRIGKIARVHVWQGSARPAPGQRVSSSMPPPHVNYDLWLGPAPERAFHPSHFHFRWRWWWDFGGGVLSDFGCHYMDLPFWALDLTAPTTIDAKGHVEYDGENRVPSVMRVDYQFPARGELSPVQLTWYHGSWTPDVHGRRSGVLFEGENGMILANYNTHMVFVGDEKGSVQERPEPWIPSSIGHHQEWIEAIKSRGPTTCNFGYSGPLSETALLGNVSYRAKQKLEWDSKAFKVTNTRDAEQFIQREYRKGWSL